MWIESNQRLQNLKAESKSRDSQLKALPSLQNRERNELDTRLALLSQEHQSLAQRRTELRLSRVTEIAAPTAGRIVELKPDAGSFVTAHSPQIAIMPEGDKLQAELQVPSSALGLVAKGTALRLHLESFPHAKFSAITGTVTEVSPVLQPATPGQGHALPTFRVLARLHTTELHRGSQAFTLQPEMCSRAFVVLERRKAWEWLFEPLLDALRR